MDSIQLGDLVEQSAILKYKFIGCCSVDNIPPLPPGNFFQLINTAESGRFGEHWLLLARRKRDSIVIFYDSFGRTLINDFPVIYSHVTTTYYGGNDRRRRGGLSIKQFFPSKSLLQSNNTTLCGLYCLFLASCIYADYRSIGSDGVHCSLPAYATEDDVLRFASESFGENFPRVVTFL